MRSSGPTCRRRPRRFNGAAVFQPRKSRQRATSTPTRASSFNGAAVFQPRKFSTMRRPASLRDEPSMGPRFFNRGNAARIAGSRRVFPVLQWGRGFSTAEICLAVTMSGMATSMPSMGPRFFNRGNVAAPNCSGCQCCLQWGRGFSTAEMHAGHVVDSLGRLSLQWGRGFSTAEMRPSSRRSRRHEHASMGPRFFNRGNTAQVDAWTVPMRLQWGRGFSTAEIRRWRSTCAHRSDAFNGAAVFQPRKSH